MGTIQASLVGRDVLYDYPMLYSLIHTLFFPHYLGTVHDGNPAVLKCVLFSVLSLEHNCKFVQPIPLPPRTILASIVTTCRPFVL